MNLEIKIVKGKNAFKLLEDKKFISIWSTLAKLQKSVTVYQEYPFVNTWYQQYVDRFQPVFVLGIDKNSQIIGIMTLAQNLTNSKLNHAGAWQAEYKGWICEHNFEEIFLVKALISIKNNFEINTWDWKWLSPRLRPNWFTSKKLSEENIYAINEEVESPLIDVQNTDRIDHIRTKKSMRVKINRFKKRGGFFIEKITSKEKALQIIDTLASQNDFRQMAVFNVAAFNDDPNKKSFLIEKLNHPNETHFTVLWCNNKPIAFNFGECDSNTVYLGVMSFDPTESKNSPGQILILELVEFIKKEGFRYLDLTPGDDKYKERFCNMHQKIYASTIYFNKKDFINSKIKDSPKNSIKRVIKKIEIEPESLLTKTIVNPLKKIKKLLSGIYCNESYLYYKLNLEQLEKFKTSSKVCIRKNNYSDLLLYNENNKSTILSHALKSFSTEDIVYTITLKNELMHYGWVTKRTKSKIFLKSNTKFDFPKDSVIIYNCFTNPNFRRQGLYTTALKEIINQYRDANFKSIYIGTAINNIASKSVIEKLKFIPYYKFKRIVFLWKTREEIIPIHIDDNL